LSKMCGFLVSQFNYVLILFSHISFWGLFDFGTPSRERANLLSGQRQSRNLVTS